MSKFVPPDGVRAYACRVRVCTRVSPFLAERLCAYLSLAHSHLSRLYTCARLRECPRSAMPSRVFATLYPRGSILQSFVVSSRSLSNSSWFQPTTFSLRRCMETRVSRSSKRINGRLSIERNVGEKFDSRSNRSLAITSGTIIRGCLK